MSKMGFWQEVRNFLWTVSRLSYVQMEKFELVVECMNLGFNGEIRLEL